MRITAPRTRPRRWRLATILAAALTMIGGAAVVTPTPAAAATIDTNTWYEIVSRHSGKALDICGSSTADGACVQQWTYANQANQQFRFLDSGSGYYRIQARHSGKVLDISGYSTADGADVVQWTDHNGVNQQFQAIDTDNGYVTLINRNSGKALDVWAKSTADGGRISQYTDNGGWNQQWQLIKVDAGTPTVAADGSGTYRTVQAAIDAVPADNTQRVVITIKPGTYRQVVRVPSNKPYITLRGLGSSPSDTVLVYNNSANSSGTFGSASMFVDGANFVAENLTIANDFDEGSVTSGQQAVALHLNADRAVLRNVRLLGDQDTFLVNDRTRAYLVDSYVEGTVDFIFGGGTIVFDRCSIYEKRLSGGPITAASTDSAKTYGFLFYRSTITGAANNVTGLGRPWRQGAQVLYRESSLSSTIKTSQPWTDMSGNTWQNARFFEYRNTGAGATTNANRPQMSDSQAANYTPQRYLAGSDGWNPM